MFPAIAMHNFSLILTALSQESIAIMPADTFPITLDHSFMISSRVKHFVFNTNHSPAFSYLPGQFITIHFEKNNKLYRRSYSIANEPKENNRIEFAAGFIEGGPGTELLYGLKPGDIIHINGPFGRLVFKDQLPKRYIFVATSTGITPYRAMMAELAIRLRKTTDLEVVILQGVQTRADILYKDEFERFAQEFSNVTFIPCLSREPAPTLENNEYKGYVQQAFPLLNLDPSGDLVYLCGNPSMIDDAFNYLKDQGFAVQQVIREKYISSATP